MTSIWAVKNRLHDLMQARREVVAGICVNCIGTGYFGLIRCEPCGGTGRLIDADALSEIDKAIREYICEEIQSNPDTVHQFLLESRARQEDLKKEIGRLEGLLAGEQGEEERAKDLVMAVSQEIGVKKFPVRGTMRVQGNGGVQAVDVVQRGMVPEEFLRVEATLPLWAWREAVEFFWEGSVNLEAVCKVGLPEPDLTAIRKELEKRVPCGDCGGKGTRQVAIDHGSVSDPFPCETCGGTGEVPNGVPGCVLRERGEHVRIA